MTQEVVMQVVRQNTEKFAPLSFARMERLPRVRTRSRATPPAHAGLE